MLDCCCDDCEEIPLCGASNCIDPKDNFILYICPQRPYYPDNVNEYFINGVSIGYTLPERGRDHPGKLFISDISMMDYAKCIYGFRYSTISCLADPPDFQLVPKKIFMVKNIILRTGSGTDPILGPDIILFRLFHVKKQTGKMCIIDSGGFSPYGRPSRPIVMYNDQICPDPSEEPPPYPPVDPPNPPYPYNPPYPPPYPPPYETDSCRLCSRFEDNYFAEIYVTKYANAGNSGIFQLFLNGVSVFYRTLILNRCYRFLLVDNLSMVPTYKAGSVARYCFVGSTIEEIILLDKNLFLKNNAIFSIAYQINYEYAIEMTADIFRVNKGKTTLCRMGSVVFYTNGNFIFDPATKYVELAPIDMRMCSPTT